MNRTLKNWILAFALFSTTLTAGCSNSVILGGEGIPDETFLGIEPVFADQGTVGNLTESYIKNTESLVIVNGRLAVICQAIRNKRCKE